MRGPDGSPPLKDLVAGYFTEPSNYLCELPVPPTELTQAATKIYAMVV